MRAYSLALSRSLNASTVWPTSIIAICARSAACSIISSSDAYALSVSALLSSSSASLHSALMIALMFMTRFFDRSGYWPSRIPFPIREDQ